MGRRGDFGLTKRPEEWMVGKRLIYSGTSGWDLAVTRDAVDVLEEAILPRDLRPPDWPLSVPPHGR